MSRHPPQRGLHYLLLIALCLLLYLPNLGCPSLWDIDEGNNLTCMSEMLAANNWRVPTFNFQLRVDKPALLYWLQMFAALRFGVGEFAGRLPSALAALLTVLATYELGRTMFGRSSALLGALTLATSILFGAAAHFANPDALLTACTTLTFFFFWTGWTHHGRIWFVRVNAMMALAVLAKGPVGIVVPCAIMGLYLLRTGRLALVRDRRVLLGAGVFLLIALPWYIWVGIDTKFAFIIGFINTHNIHRALSPMEGHGGPIYYYLAVLAAGLAPWSVLLPAVCWQVYRERPIGESSWKRWLLAIWRVSPDSSRATQARAFLVGWIVVYLVFFTVARTKLPNYILPIYPAVALLLGDVFERWRGGSIELPAWLWRASLLGLAGIGVAMIVGFLVLGGVFEPPLLHVRPIAGLGGWAPLGIVPVAGTIVAAWLLRRGRRTAVLVSFAATADVMLFPLATWGGAALNDVKAPHSLARLIQEGKVERDIRIAAYGYFQPSLVFYCRREVSTLSSEKEIRDFLETPMQVFLITPWQTWQQLSGESDMPGRILGRHWDMYRRCDVVVVTNQP